MRTIEPSLSSLLLTPQKAADYIGFARSTLRKLRKAGKIKAKMHDGRRYFPPRRCKSLSSRYPDAH